MSLWRKKPIVHLLQEGEKTSLRRALGALDLVLLGIGAIIGTGIFVLTGVVSAQYSGPALILSFILSGLAPPSPRCRTRSSRPPSLFRGAFTPTPTPPWANS